MQLQLDAWVAHLGEEQQKVVLNQLISKLTDKCFDKCVSYAGKRLSSGEESCLKFCSLRQLDAAQFIQHRLTQQNTMQ